LRAAALYYTKRKRARVAKLLDHFHGPHLGAAIGKLTDRQIELFYFHARDKDSGAIIFPKKSEIDPEPETLEKVLRDLAYLELMMGDKLEGYEEAVASAHAKFATLETK
jgi:hypothetical protein